MKTIKAPSGCISFKAAYRGLDLLAHLMPNELSGGYYIEIVKIRDNMICGIIYNAMAPSFTAAKDHLFKLWPNSDWRPVTDDDRG